MDGKVLSAVAVGGVLGAATRWAVVESLPSWDDWPLAVFILNIVGSVVLGFVAAELWSRPSRQLVLRLGVGTGFCGSLTTFSTFSLEVAELWRDGRAGLAMGHVVAFVFVGLLAAAGGMAARRAIHRRRVAAVAA